MDSDDFSLVALASLSRDAVVLTALRESVVLYAAMVAGCGPIEYEYEWAVDPIIQERAARFVATFNELFDESLPEPVADNAQRFSAASDGSKIIGRCVRIGLDDTVQPPRQYHWAIDHLNNKPVVKEFWDTQIWTTERYREGKTHPPMNIHIDSDEKP